MDNKENNNSKNIKSDPGTTYFDNNVSTIEIQDTNSTNNTNSIESNNDTGIIKEVSFNITECNKHGFAYDKIGNYRVFYYNKGKPIFMIGPDWPFFAGTFVGSISMAFILLFLLWNHLGRIFYWLCFIYPVYVCMYILAATSNPGIPNYTNKELNEEIDKGNKILYCKTCNLYSIEVKNSRSKLAHCDICKICIKGFDHHCTFTSKCIGEGNLVLFYMFVISAGMASLSSFGSVMYIFATNFLIK